MIYASGSFDVYLVAAYKGMASQEIIMSIIWNAKDRSDFLPMSKLLAVNEYKDEKMIN